MTHPIVSLQSSLVTALRDDIRLAGLSIVDGPPKGLTPPYVAIARHDLLSRSGDAAIGYEHRVLFHIWSDSASRKAALEIAAVVQEVALGAALDGDVVPTLRRHERTDTAIDDKTGLARVALALTFFTEA